MANSLPSFGILSTELFPILRTKAAQLSRYTTNFGADVANAGTAVVVGYQSSVSASLWDSSNKYTSADETISSTTVTLKEPYYVEFYLSPNELKAYGDAYLQKRMAAAAAGVCDEVRKQALSLLTGTSVASVGTVSGSAHNFNTVLSGSNILINSGSQGEISFLAPSTQYSALLVDAKNAGYNISNTVVSGVEQWTYGPATVVREANLSTPVVATQDAVAIATRLPEQFGSYQRTIFADELTGLSIAVDLFESPDTGKVIGRAHVCAGVALGRPGTCAKWTTP